MGGFGSGRYGGKVTSEGTASYVIGASILTRARLQLGEFGKGTFHVDDGDFAIEVIVDTTDPPGPFMELIHKDARRSGGRPRRERPHSPPLDRADLWRAALVVSVSENRPPNHKAVSAKRRTAFLEPCRLRPRLRLPTGGKLRAPPAPGRDAEPAARR